MAWLLPYVLIGLGVGFLVANVRAFSDFLRYRRRRKNAVLIWPGPPPPFYGLVLFLGVALGVLIFVKVVFLHRGFLGIFGEVMMFIYFATRCRCRADRPGVLCRRRVVGAGGSSRTTRLAGLPAGGRARHAAADFAVPASWPGRCWCPPATMGPCGGCFTIRSERTTSCSPATR
jgi:hypothetical protein